VLLHGLHFYADRRKDQFDCLKVFCRSFFEPLRAHFLFFLAATPRRRISLMSCVSFCREYTLWIEIFHFPGQRSIIPDVLTLT